MVATTSRTTPRATVNRALVTGPARRRAARRARGRDDGDGVEAHDAAAQRAGRGELQHGADRRAEGGAGESGEHEKPIPTAKGGNSEKRSSAAQ